MTTITSADGVKCEAAYDAPEEPWGSVVFCHPHPRQGGTMHAPLLVALRDALVERGLAVVRFNFRGVGASEGETGDGTDEIADAEGALAFAAERVEGPQGLLGWSFGAAVAIRTAVKNPRVGACVAIAPAVTERPGYTSGLPAADELELKVPTLFVIASNDDQIDPQTQRAWATGAGVDVVEVAGANHFFWARYDQLAVICGDFLEERLG